jgi:hypothetical protein
MVIDEEGGCPMAAIAEVLFAGLAGLCWLAAALFFSPWRKSFTEKLSADTRVALQALDVHYGCVSASAAAVCSAVAAFCRVLAASHML